VAAGKRRAAQALTVSFFLFTNMADFRFNPFRFQYRPVNITGEVKTVAFFPAFGRYGFFLNETPVRLQTQPVSIICAGDTLAEVGRTATPDANNFRVDYGNVNNAASTGFVEIHSSRVGQVATINYRAVGVNLNASFRSDAKANLQRSVIAPNAAAQGLNLPGRFTAQNDISANGLRFRKIADALASGDMLNLRKFLAVGEGGGVRIFTAGSGNWTPPLGVQYVFVAMIGSGGAGAASVGGTGGAGGGGSGSPAIYAIVDLTTLGPPPYEYFVPAGKSASGLTDASFNNGEHSTIFSMLSGRGGGGAYNVISGVGTGGTGTNGSLFVATGKIVTATADGSSLNGGNNSGATSGAGGTAAAMLTPFAPLFSGAGGAAAGANTVGISGTNYGGGGSGGGGGFADRNGGGSGGGLIMLIY